MTRTFKLKKETKGTWQYQEVPHDQDDPELMCGALYLKKRAVPADTQGSRIPPQEITVTIAEV